MKRSQTEQMICQSKIDHRRNVLLTQRVTLARNVDDEREFSASSQMATIPMH
ncbi:hypothetical protein RRSWK_03808 [Rhodopirellula sp. SWK7]|nr:hypothetical protein RRSWK_03808 [Rhodopirellula sp. SWK7]